MDDNSQKDIMADFALKELLIRLMQTQARGMVEKNIVKNKSRIGFVVDYIKRNLHQKLSIDSIAKLAYVSKSNFFKMFKDELGTSPNDFILQERISRAKELLASQTSIKETAFQTGFSDTNYFTRVFRSRAPCKMNEAAAESIRSARLARETSMPIKARSAATVERRSSQ